MPLSEHVYCVAVAFKMTEWVQWQICIEFCIKLEHSSAETILTIQKAAAMGYWWLAASSQQCSLFMWHILFRVFWWNIKSPRWLSPLQSRFGNLNFWLLPKLKSSLKGKRFQNINEISEKYSGAADGNWENCVRSQGAYFEGDWAVVVLHAVFLASSSINVSIFHSAWLDTFWTDLAYLSNTYTYTLSIVCITISVPFC